MTGLESLYNYLIRLSTDGTIRMWDCYGQCLQVIEVGDMGVWTNHLSTSGCHLHVSVTSLQLRPCLHSALIIPSSAHFFINGCQFRIWQPPKICGALPHQKKNDACTDGSGAVRPRPGVRVGARRCTHDQGIPPAYRPIRRGLMYVFLRLPQRQEHDGDDTGR